MVKFLEAKEAKIFISAPAEANLANARLILAPFTFINCYPWKVGIIPFRLDIDQLSFRAISL